MALLVLAALLAGATYRPPVDAPVVDPFRAPACRWCPGNRGLEYRTTPGTAVRASAAGVIQFAGRVAGTRYVVVAHPDGLRTTYGALVLVAVEAGMAVGAGAVLGTAGPRLHFGVRRGATYLDPARLFAVRARLVPLGRLGEAVGVRLA